MAKHANPKAVLDSPKEWLDEYNIFSIWQILLEIIGLWGLNIQTETEPKKLRRSEREMATPLFFLRCVQLGISIRDLDLLSIGMVNDMYVGSGNDSSKYERLADYKDFDLFTYLRV